MYTSTNAPAAHRRENTSLLAKVEKRTLVSIAARLPPWINADHLSALGLAAMLGAGLMFAALAVTPWAAAGVVLALVLNWLGDSLDGTLARVRGHQRPRYGYYVDHAIDLAGAVMLLGGLAVSGLMTPLAAFIALAAYLLVSAETYLATHAIGVFRMSFVGFGPTELRILLAIGAVRAAADPWVSLGPLGSILLFDLGAAVATAALLAIFLISVVSNGLALYRAEPLPHAGATTSGRTVASPGLLHAGVTSVRAKSSPTKSRESPATTAVA